MYTCATMAYSIELQNTLTFVVYISKRKAYKQVVKTFHKKINVKECSDVNRQ